ncbi:RNA metabolism translation [Cryptosporidium sp. chipmunk genotype I]|uniref:RNA metabolism translation n=1 Tax=Cryptosporidium sp. chipmunk genotype I TaxID=1280935 RepID=UPI003519EA8A|nr:RNA metabolism translation [Cryptosporidium sp. chipmunk genotype I]
MARTRSKYVELTDDDYYDAYDSDYYSEDADAEYEKEVVTTAIKGNTTVQTEKKSNIVEHVVKQNKDKAVKSRMINETIPTPSLENYSCVVLGHVDSGKSTLMGHLFVSLGLISEGVMRKYKKESEIIGKGSFAYAWIFDDCDDERERGITINVSAKSMMIEKKLVTILDAPGHSEFIPNSFSISMFSDNIIIVIDSSGFEAGFQRGQTIEHIIYSLLAGVSNIIFAVNKLDLCNWDEQVYSDIVNTISNYINSELSDIKSDSDIIFLPISAYCGVNILNDSNNHLPKEISSWYQGPSLFEILSSIHYNSKRSRPRPIECHCHKQSKQFASFSACILEIISVSSSEFKAALYIEYGQLKVGQSYFVLPSTEPIKCKAISIHNNTYNSCNGPIYISSATFYCTINPSIGNIIVSTVSSKNSTKRNSNTPITSLLSSLYPIQISRKLKVKRLKLLNETLLSSKNIFWNVPGQSFMIYYHCEASPATLLFVNDDILYFETEKEIVSYNKCSCTNTTNLSKVSVRFFGITVLIGEMIFH